MSKDYRKLILTSCTVNQTKLQAIADLLLLTNNIWPIFHGEPYANCIEKCKDFILTKTKGLLVLIAKVPDMLLSPLSAACDIYNTVQDMIELAIGLIEFCAHAGYLVGQLFPGYKKEQKGVLIPYVVQRTAIDIDTTCQLFKISDQDLLTPQALLDVSSSLGESLSTLTQCYVTASDDPSVSQLNQEQFRACVKCFASSGAIVTTSIKCYKTSPSHVLHCRCVAFCDALKSTVQAAVIFANEQEFVGMSAVLSHAANEVRKSILGACMSLVSCCIQLFGIIKDLINVPHHSQSQERLSLCIDAISRSTERLADVFSQTYFQSYHYYVNHPIDVASGVKKTQGSSQNTSHHHHHHHHSKKKSGR